MLDILIYIDFYTKKNDRLGDIIENILYKDNLQILIDKMSTCLVQRNKQEWQNILNFIKQNVRLSNLVLWNVKDDSVLRTVCFKDAENNYIVIFRGTSTSNEWVDNGKGAYLDETIDQKEALKFIENINAHNLTVSGHSKGGNLAQYVTILSNKVSYCVAVNSQGFSKEFVSKYKNRIDVNREKIICINGKYDYVNCLLKNISRQNIFIMTEKQKNPLYYHKCEILLDNKGILRAETKKPFFNKIINDFSVSLLSDLPKDVQIMVFNSLMDGIKTLMCKDKFLDENFIKIVFSTIILIIYGKYFKYKESILLFYSLIEIITVPVLVWNDFIECDETKDNVKYFKLIDKIKYIEKKPLLKIKNLQDNNIYGKLQQTIKSFFKDLNNVSVHNE